MRLSIMEGQAGLAVYLDNTRIAGVRDNGLMRERYGWEVKPSEIVDAIEAGDHLTAGGGGG